MRLTLEQADRIILNHESGVQLTGVEVYRQLKSQWEEIAALGREREAVASGLRRLLDGDPSLGTEWYKFALTKLLHSLLDGGLRK